VLGAREPEELRCTLQVDRAPEARLEAERIVQMAKRILRSTGKPRPRSAQGQGVRA
jgi:hypothetical protein